MLQRANSLVKRQMCIIDGLFWTSLDDNVDCFAWIISEECG